MGVRTKLKVGSVLLLIGVGLVIFFGSGCAKKEVVKPTMLTAEVKDIFVEYPVKNYGGMKYFDMESKQEITEAEYMKRLKVWVE